MRSGVVCKIAVGNRYQHCLGIFLYKHCLSDEGSCICCTFSLYTQMSQELCISDVGLKSGLESIFGGTWTRLFRTRTQNAKDSDLARFRLESGKI